MPASPPVFAARHGATRLQCLALVAVCLGLFLTPDTASAQLCGYGTSEQDCQIQNRDARAAEEARQHYQRELDAQGGDDQTGYSAEPSASSGPRAVYGYVAVAWHPDSSDVWATWNSPTEESATTSALHSCKLSMGAGCTIALSAWNSTIAVAKAPDGGLKIGWGAKPEEAASKALADCASDQAGCTVQHRFTAKPFALAQEYAPRQAARVSFAMIAWPKSAAAPEWQGKIWMVSGKGGYAQSSTMLLNRCKADTGIDCQIQQWARGDDGTKRGGVIARYNNPDHGLMWFASATAADAKRRMEEDCAREEVTCDGLVTYDTFTPRLTVIDSPAFG